MTSTTMSGFISDLGRVAYVRSELAHELGAIAHSLTQAETSSDSASGKLNFDTDIEDLTRTSQNLRQGVFRLLVLGDMKRGKSTLLNALIGENLLPSDVNPCTALLTLLRYGPEKRVTVHFKGDRPAEVLDFPTFKQRYTIDPDESKQLEQRHQVAFPDVDYAVVEYPLPLLEKGIEIVDSPGLNDTELRNQLSLGYINNCHAILFVLRASQPLTLDERRYLDTYIKDRGLTVFFLVNGWDEVRRGLVNPEDEAELRAAEENLRTVFRTNLEEYCRVDGQLLYDQRVFEVSALQALRQRLRDGDASLSGTGLPEFMAELNAFLTQERAIAEFRQARTLARQVLQRVNEALNRRIPMLDQGVEELKQRIASVEPDFQKLTEIRDQLQSIIQQLGDRTATQLADDFRDYVLGLEDTFEQDFLRYQPDINFWDFLSQGKRDAFNTEFKRAFERYTTEKLVEWERQAEQQVETAFFELAELARTYGTSYTQVTDLMTEKLTGQSRSASDSSAGETSPSWANWAMGFFSLATGNVAGVALAAVGFDWKNIFVNWVAVIGINSFLFIFTGALLGPVGIALTSLGVGALQADQARREFVKATRKEFAKTLPTVATEQRQQVYQAVNECFTRYEQEVIRRLNEDIQSREAELSNLLQQKESREIDSAAEAGRLEALKSEVNERGQRVESIYGSMFV